jgi:hypothetical protein
MDTDFIVYFNACVFLDFIMHEHGRFEVMNRNIYMYVYINRKKKHLLKIYKIKNVKKKMERLHLIVHFVNQVHVYNGRSSKLIVDIKRKVIFKA